MTATITPTPSSTAAALTSTNAADSGGDSDATSSFAGVFQNLLGKAMAKDGSADATLDARITDIAATSDEAATALDAMLPFLEAIGFIPGNPAVDMAKEIMPQEGELVGDAADTSALVAALTPDTQASQTAISAGSMKSDGLAPISQWVTEAATAVGTTPTGTDTAGADTAEGVKSGGDFNALIAAASGDGKAGTSKTAELQSATQNVNVSGVTASINSSLTGASQPHQPTATVSEPVGSPAWGQEVGQRVVWMANRAMGQAELVLTPPQMGRVEVHLTVNGDQATASFASTNPVVREALEAALPRLREVLADAGIQLGQAQVGSENPRQTAQQDKNPDNSSLRGSASAGDASNPSAEERLSSTAALKLGRGLVDVFA